jgi:hypothetical protein
MNAQLTSSVGAVAGGINLFEVAEFMLTVMLERVSSLLAIVLGH